MHEIRNNPKYSYVRKIPEKNNIHVKQANLTVTVQGVIFLTKRTKPGQLTLIGEFLGPSPSAISGKNSKHLNIYELMQCFAVDFSRKRAWRRFRDLDSFSKIRR